MLQTAVRSNSEFCCCLGSHQEVQFAPMFQSNYFRSTCVGQQLPRVHERNPNPNALQRACLRRLGPVCWNLIVSSVLSTLRTTPLRTAVSLAAQAAMQRLNGALHQASKVVSRGTSVSGSVLPHTSVKPCFRGASRFIVHAAQEAPAADSDDNRSSAVRRRRLFRGQSGAAGESSSTGDSSSAGSSSRAPPRKPRTTSEPPRDVLEDFAAAFESTLSRTPKVGSGVWSDWVCCCM